MINLSSSDYFSMKIGFAYNIYENARRIEPHNHDYFEFFTILSGKAIHVKNGETEIIQPGTICFIRPDDLHSFSSAPNSTFKILNIMYSTEVIKKYFHFLDINISDLPSSTFITQDKLNIIWDNVKKITSVADPNETIFLNRSLLSIIIHNYLFFEQIAAPHDMPIWLTNLLYDMQKKENFIEGMPAMLKLSKKSHGHICKSFLKYFGYSPIDYINTLRLNYAEFLLTNSNFSILDIAFESGFNNTGHFIKKFKAKYTYTPSVYRKINS